MKRPTSPVLRLTNFALAAALFCSYEAGQVPAENTATSPPLRLAPASPQPLTRPEETHTMLDPRVANALDVAYAPLPDGRYRFDVILFR
jgi:hypothetical protein